jgi:hypothetical protein
MLGNLGEAGKLVPADEYYSLDATDLSGLTWKTERLLVSRSFSPSGSITRGPIYVLEHSEPSDSENTTIILEIFNDVRLPFANRTKEDLSLEAGEPAFHLRDRASLKTDKCDLTIRRDNDILIIRAAVRNKDFPENFETRIIESLQYVTSRTLSWGILQKNANKNWLTILRSPDKPVPPAKLSPPIDYILSDLYGRWTWMLFGKYLEHIDKFVGENRFQMHPLSAWLNYARNASSGSIFSKGLGLGVAVEGILECEFSLIGRPSLIDTSGLEEMIKHVSSFSGNENILSRTLGALDAMRNPRAKDRLFALQEVAAIRQEDIKAWDDIRNRGAHARPPEKGARQEWIDNCYKTEVLLNHLIFHAIGYEGEFTDYGTANWPQSRYPFKIKNPC